MKTNMNFAEALRQPHGWCLPLGGDNVAFQVGAENPWPYNSEAYPVMRAPMTIAEIEALTFPPRAQLKAEDWDASTKRPKVVQADAERVLREDKEREIWHVQKLRDAVADSMWHDHAEVSKSLLTGAANIIEAAAARIDALKAAVVIRDGEKQEMHFDTPQIWQYRVEAKLKEFPSMTHEEAQHASILSELVELRKALKESHDCSRLLNSRVIIANWHYDLIVRQHAKDLAAASLQAVVAVPPAILERTEEVRQTMGNPTGIGRATLIGYVESLLAHIAFTNAAPQPSAASLSRDNEQQVMRQLAEFIAASAHPEDERLEVAYAIARHLKLDWPAAAPSGDEAVLPEKMSAEMREAMWEAIVRHGLANLEYWIEDLYNDIRAAALKEKP